MGRSLLILARALGIGAEWGEVQIQNLIPSKLSDKNPEELLSYLSDLDAEYHLPQNEVYRYIAQLSVDLELGQSKLSTELITVPKNTLLGQIQDSESLFEIYTHSNPDQPIIVKGNRVGVEATAQSLLGDILRLIATK